MKRCIECGRPYRGGLVAPALLELALDELKEGELEDEHIQTLMRTRKALRRVSDRLDEAIQSRAYRMAHQESR